MERATIIVHGAVQGVGLRYTVRACAAPLKITGHIKNLEDGTVEIIAEGAKQSIESLVQRIRDAEEPAVVENVIVSYQKATGEFKMFRVMLGDMLAEIAEGFATEQAHFTISHKKQDQTIAEIRGSTDRILDKQDQTIAEIHGLSGNLHDMMDHRFQRLEGEIHQIKEKIGL